MPVLIGVGQLTARTPGPDADPIEYALTCARLAAEDANIPGAVYPLFANAFRKAQGLTLPQYLADTARLCARLAAVAKDEPYAWFRDGKTAEQIATVTPSNPMINYPFTKYMNSMINVDQG